MARERIKVRKGTSELVRQTRIHKGRPKYEPRIEDWDEDFGTETSDDAGTEDSGRDRDTDSDT